VEHVADQLLALGMVERVILLGELLGDDVADFLLDLRTRHLVERLEVDEVEQALVELDLEVGMLVALGERAGIANRDEALLVDRADLGLVGGSRGAFCRLLDLPHLQRSRPSAAASPVSSTPRSLPTALLRLMSLIGTPWSIADRINRKAL